MDLYSIFGRAVRELHKREGSTIEDIESYARQRYAVEEVSVGALTAALTLAGGLHRRGLYENHRYRWQFDLPAEISEDEEAPGLLANEVLARLPKRRDRLATAASLNNNPEKTVTDPLTQWSVSHAATSEVKSAASTSTVIDDGLAGPSGIQHRTRLLSIISMSGDTSDTDRT